MCGNRLLVCDVEHVELLSKTCQHIIWMGQRALVCNAYSLAHVKFEVHLVFWRVFCCAVVFDKEPGCDKWWLAVAQRHEILPRMVVLARALACKCNGIVEQEAPYLAALLQSCKSTLNLLC